MRWQPTGWIALAITLVVLAYAYVELRHSLPRPARGELPADVVRAIASSESGSIPRLEAEVIRVIDGDSVDVQLESGPIQVRLHAADAPEYDQPGGKAAGDALSKRLKRGRAVDIEPVEQDRYDRLVAVLYEDGENMNGWLVQQGHAWAYRNYTRDERYCGWEDEARAARRGLWSRPAADWIAPWDWRRRHREPSYRPVDHSGETLEACLAALHRRRPAANPTVPIAPDVNQPMELTPPGACKIKGNIGSGGARIYHLPGSDAYGPTKIDPGKGERWFCTEQEARDAGWRPPR